MIKMKIVPMIEKDQRGPYENETPRLKMKMEKIKKVKRITTWKNLSLFQPGEYHCGMMENIYMTVRTRGMWHRKA